MLLEKLRNARKEKAKEKEKAKIEKEKKRRRNRKYGQMELKHSRRGIASCVFAACTLFLIVLVLSVSYISKGDVNLLIGLAGLFAVLFSWAGLMRGVQGFKERDKNYLSCKIGIGCNAAFLLSLIAIFLRGLF